MPVKLKSEAEEFRQAIRIDIGGLEMRAQEGKGSRFEVARKFCELQHSLVASTTASIPDRLAALNDIGVAVNTLHARFPGVFAGANDLVVSARKAILTSEDIEHLKRDFEAADLDQATLLLDGRSAALAWEMADGPFKDQLLGELFNCWLAVKEAHSDEQVRDLLGKHLDDCLPTVGNRAAGSSPSASDVASLRAAESTKVTLPPLRIHAEPAGPSGQVPHDSLLLILSQQRALMEALATDGASTDARDLFKAIVANIRGLPDAGDQVARRRALLFDLSAAELNRGKGWINRNLPLEDEGIGLTVNLPKNVVALSRKIDMLLDVLLPLDASDLGDRLLPGEVADLIDQIVLDGKPGEDVLFAKLGQGLGALRLTHKDPAMRTEMGRVLGCCFDQPGDTWPVRAITGERRLETRVNFLLTEGPKMAPGPNKLDDFALKLVDDIKRDTGDDSPLMLHLLDELDGLPNLDQLKQAIYQRLADDSV
jgi:hypothetical protein